ncbi:hypothetical protein [Calothrix sp. PCC 7507]|uniref:hypothetical protein n=1 Tax=Calothrix sp. PCC 7507 TaxID=99598 RepID=UPI00029F1269|nr:hypothetical protein [Calothrix sp. PCC 7507]AFY34868.1 hypothetical protein Cal7507_4499 [Calothrix sp. PCC 7507]
MPVIIDDNENPASSDATLNLIQIVKSLAYQIKHLTGKSNWYTPPDTSFAAIMPKLERVQLSDFLFFHPTKINCTGTTALTQLYSYTIPANTLTANSVLKITALLGMSNNTNTKTFRCRIAGTDIFSSSSQISGYTSVLYQRSLLLRSSNSQITIPNDINAYSRYTNSIQEFTFNFTQNQTLSFHVQPSMSSDSMWLEYVYGEILKL